MVGSRPRRQRFMGVRGWRLGSSGSFSIAILVCQLTLIIQWVSGRVNSLMFRRFDRVWLSTDGRREVMGLGDLEAMLWVLLQAVTGVLSVWFFLACLMRLVLNSLNLAIFALRSPSPSPSLTPLVRLPCRGSGSDFFLHVSIHPLISQSTSLFLPGVSSHSKAEVLFGENIKKFNDYYQPFKHKPISLFINPHMGPYLDPSQCQQCCLLFNRFYTMGGCLNSCCCTQAGLLCHSVLTLCGFAYFAFMFLIFHRQQPYFEFEIPDSEGTRWACLFSALLFLLWFIVAMTKIAKIQANQVQGEMKKKISLAEVRELGKGTSNFGEDRQETAKLLNEE